MKDYLAKILAWLRQSTTAKKYSMGIGGLFLGAYLQHNYWQFINKVLAYVGLTDSDYQDFLKLGLGITLPIVSIWLSAAMTADDKQVVADKALAKEIGATQVPPNEPPMKPPTPEVKP